MIIFLSIYFTLYSLMHFYLYRKAKLAFPRFVRPVRGVVFSVIMMSGPIAVRMLDGRGFYDLAQTFSPVVHAWMAILFWFVVTAAVVDLWNLLNRLVIRRLLKGRKLHFEPKPAFMTIAVVVIAASTWGAFKVSDLRIERVTLELSTLPPGTEPIRVVHISDLHLGLFMTQDLLQRVVDKIEGIEPDVIVSTGDMLDSSFHDTKLSGILATLNPPMGKYAVLGNHEFYVREQVSVEFHEAAEFKILRADSVVVGGRLRIAGVDDPACRRVGGGCFIDENVALPPIEGREATILLKHQPYVDEGSLGRFDVQLSGHTHDGQIFPFGLLLRLFRDYNKGLYELENGSFIYINPGTGWWGPPMRLLSWPEITVLTLTPAER